MTRVRIVLTADGDLGTAGAGNAITLALADEIDVARGTTLSSPDQRPQVADQVAAQTKEQLRSVNADYQEIAVQKEALEAATIYLTSLEDTEAVRKQLTPEFMLVKLQAQEDLANAARSHVRSIADYNVSLARLAQITGTVLQFHHVRSSMPALMVDAN